MNNIPQDSFFNEGNEVKASFIKWGKEGDYVKGVLTDVREIKSNLPGKEGTKTKLYEIKVSKGSFHDIDEVTKQPIEPGIELDPESFWLIGGRVAIDGQMRKAKIGQTVGMVYSETKAPKQKGFNATKVIKVYLGPMDESWMGEHPGDLEQ